MIAVTPYEQLGRFRNEWLNARHHFSFGSYFDPEKLGWGALRVWNDDEIAPGTGFDVVPTDCLSALLKRELPSATSLVLAFEAGGGPSPGTVATSSAAMRASSALPTSV